MKPFYRDFSKERNTKLAGIHRDVNMTGFHLCSFCHVSVFVFLFPFPLPQPAASEILFQKRPLELPNFLKWHQCNTTNLWLGVFLSDITLPGSETPLSSVSNRCRGSLKETRLTLWSVAIVFIPRCFFFFCARPNEKSQQHEFRLWFIAELFKRECVCPAFALLLTVALAEAQETIFKVGLRSRTCREKNHVREHNPSQSPTSFSFRHSVVLYTVTRSCNSWVITKTQQ